MKEIIVVPYEDDTPSEQTGKVLARAGAGYLHQWLLYNANTTKKIIIGVAWGFVLSQVVAQLESMSNNGIIQTIRLGSNVTWATLIGPVTKMEEPNWEANQIARRLQHFYGGEIAFFQNPGFIDKGAGDEHVGEHGLRLMKDLANADLILTSAAPWGKDATLIVYGKLDPASLPGFDKATGTMCGVFLGRNDQSVEIGYRINGIGFEGFQNVAKSKEVVLICGATNRRSVVRAALQAGIVSTLITTSATAKDLLQAG